MMPIQPMRLSDVPANLRPNDMTLLILLFLAFLRRYGFLPPTETPKDDEFTRLGLDGGFAKAQSDSAAHIMALTTASPETKAMLLYSMQLAAGKYRSGDLTIS